MKRFYKPVLFALLFVFLFAGFAFAGIFSSVGGYLKSEAISLLIGGLVGSLGVFGVSYKLWGVAGKELGEFVWFVYGAFLPESEGGREVTQNEMKKILKEGAEIYPAVATAIASHKK